MWPSRGWRLQWKLSDYPLGYSVKVYKSSSPTGPWEEIGVVDIDTVVFEDSSTQSWRGIFQENFYKITVVNELNEEQVTSVPMDTRAQSDLITNEVIRQHELRLYGTNGHPGHYGATMAVFKRTRHGQICSYCRGSNGQKGMVANCQQCHGTGYLQGYSNPIITRFQALSGDSLTRQVSTLGETEEMTNPFWTAAYPYLAPSDIMVEKGTGRRWLIISVEMSRPNGIVTSQRVTCSLMDPQSIESQMLRFPGEP